MGSVFRALMNLPLFKSVLRPVTRVIVGVIAIPIFRFIMRRVFRLQDLDDELEKDLEQWFRGALLLLAASANMEHLLFSWMERLDWMDRMDWLTMGLRLMLAIGVIEAMPDQELFAVIHPGPPKIKPGRSFFREFWRLKWKFAKGLVCQHLNRLSPVLAMMCAIVGAELPDLIQARETVTQNSTMLNWAIVQPIGAAGAPQNAMAATLLADNAAEIQDMATDYRDYRRHWERWMVGWVCYLMAITQYLIIGLVTSRDRAMDVLSEFDRAVAQRRQELIEEFQLSVPQTSAAGTTPGGSTTPADSQVGDAAAAAPDTAATERSSVAEDAGSGGSERGTSATSGEDGAPRD
ncbi:MAG: hypothetical protein R3C19_04095 [Planctomycetaceae bacterium]